MKKLIIAGGKYEEQDFAETDVIAVSANTSVISEKDWDTMSDTFKISLIKELKLKVTI